MGWERANQLKAIAVSHTTQMNNKYADEIKRAIDNTILYDSNSVFDEYDAEAPQFIVDSKDSVASIFTQRRNGTVAVLNFASYKEPGGGFIRGAMAQEEALCHSSYLYSVLKAIPSYYTWNFVHKNRGMYTNRALYTPNVRFIDENKNVLAGVITCAAPNRSVSLKYGNFTDKENSAALDSRIKFISDIANEQHPDILILGAFGCGVFCNEATEVAKLFKKHFETSLVKKIVFSIPDSRNRRPFEEIFS